MLTIIKETIVLTNSMMCPHNLKLVREKKNPLLSSFKLWHSKLSDYSKEERLFHEWILYRERHPGPSLLIFNPSSEDRFLFFGLPSLGRSSSICLVFKSRALPSTTPLLGSINCELAMVWVCPPKAHILEAWSLAWWCWGGEVFGRWGPVLGD